MYIYFYIFIDILYYSDANNLFISLWYYIVINACNDNYIYVVYIVLDIYVLCNYLILFTNILLSKKNISPIFYIGDIPYS